MVSEPFLFQKVLYFRRDRDLPVYPPCIHHMVAFGSQLDVDER